MLSCMKETQTDPLVCLVVVEVLGARSIKLNWAVTISGVSCSSSSSSSSEPASPLHGNHTWIGTTLTWEDNSSTRTYYSRTSLSDRPNCRSGTWWGSRLLLNGSLHLGAQTFVSVGVLAREVKPCDGNLFHDMVPLMTSYKQHCWLAMCRRSDQTVTSFSGTWRSKNCFWVCFCCDCSTLCMVYLGRGQRW